MSVKKDDVIFLLGAGCSVDAGIPTVNQMVHEIESKLIHTDEWEKYRQLYYYIKSAVIYSDGIFGEFDRVVGIERLMIVLSELEKKEKNIVYPFIANWNNRLIDLAGTNFEKIKELRELITRQLLKWVKLPNYQPAQYYKRFYDFQQELGYPIRMFSLNYDLCLEHSQPNAVDLELGFDDNGEWNSYRFDLSNQAVSAGIYLYKLHGSIDWTRDSEHNNILQLAAHPVDTPDLIFGTEVKMQSIDPYLFNVYELRNYLLACKLVIVIGYSFSDDYINSLLRQALQKDVGRAILIIDLNKSPNFRDSAVCILKPKQLEQVKFHARSAKEFIEEDLNVETVLSHFMTVEETVF